MRTELEATLEQLHQQLAQADSLDSVEREKLQSALEEIKQSLDQQEVSSHSLAKRLQEATEHAQDSYPSLTANLGRVADMLAQMGI